MMKTEPSLFTPEHQDIAESLDKVWSEIVVLDYITTHDPLFSNEADYLAHVSKKFSPWSSLNKAWRDLWNEVELALALGSPQLIKWPLPCLF